MKKKNHIPLCAATTLSVISLLLSGCAAGKNYHLPQTDLPSTWNTPDEKMLPDQVETERSPSVNEEAPWWNSFDDNALSALIEKALANNRNLKIAEARVLEARALRKSTAASLYPQLNATGIAERGNNLVETTTKPINLYQAGFDASYEIDLFGGNRRRVEAANAAIQSSESAYQNISLSLTAEVAGEYMTLRQTQRLLDLTRKTAESQQQLDDIVRAKKEGGIVSDFDVTQSETLLKTTLARIPELERQLAATGYRLSTLLGEAPGAIHNELQEMKPVPVARTLTTLDSPAEVIARRPDIQTAERNLASATALTGSAISEMYPKITLSALFGVEDTSLGGNMNPWNLGSSVFMPLLNFGKIRGQIKASEARQTQALYAYEQTVIEALSEVETALTNLSKENRTRLALQDAANSSEKTVAAARARYQSGVSEFTEVLQSEQNSYDIERNLVVSEAGVGRYTIALYKALALNIEPQNN